MARVKTPFKRQGKTYSMNMWLKAPETGGGVKRVSFQKKEEEEESENYEKEEKKLLTMAAENGWRVAGWRGKGGREWRPTLGSQGR